MVESQYDICIVGGGINGAGIARDAAGRGLKVLLVDQGDFASCTSSASSKMIHGGLRYLEFYDFGLVRKSLAEREVILAIAPQIVQPMEFCIPHQNAVRPVWMVRIGLFIYDHLWPRKQLRSSSLINLKYHKYGQPLKKGICRGFTYSDCWVDDARLVILNLKSAELNGATVKNYTRCTNLTRNGRGWDISLKDMKTNRDDNVFAKVVINATGPYVHEFLKTTNHLMNDTPTLRLVQGSHIVVPKLYDGDHSYLLQMTDKRVIFVFPYGKYTMCGTTETDFNGDPVEATATQSEKSYLCKALNDYFEKQTSPQDIVWSFSGVRPLFEDHETDVRTISRDYRFYQDRKHDGALLLSIFGGKITTYRTLAEEALELLEKDFPQMKGKWTSQKTLPDCPVNLQTVSPDKGDIEYFIHEEWAKDIDDIIWRRTKWGVHLSKDRLERVREMALSLLEKEDTHVTE
ncbi:MAG: glycerol-3-phosphate dehydrogenase [Pseudobdellovibrionaceae bacterium]|jgi:glycerol-3-phosphate dehydrogenase|nr:glycerol-3-phosphate dehydrogenase [Pseudobdellovibrionaceae bacterium]